MSFVCEELNSLLVYFERETTQQVDQRVHSFFVEEVILV